MSRYAEGTETSVERSKTVPEPDYDCPWCRRDLEELPWPASKGEEIPPPPAPGRWSRRFGACPGCHHLLRWSGRQKRYLPVERSFLAGRYLLEVERDEIGLAIMEAEQRRGREERRVADEAW